MSDPKYKHIGHIEDKLVEELSELIKAIMKARRFGYFDYHPQTPDISNLQKIMMEIEDVTDRMEEYWNFITEMEKYDGNRDKCENTGSKDNIVYADFGKRPKGELRLDNNNIKSGNLPYKVEICSKKSVRKTTGKHKNNLMRKISCFFGLHELVEKPIYQGIPDITRKVCKYCDYDSIWNNWRG